MQISSYCILDFAIIRVVTAVLQANHNEVSLQLPNLLCCHSLHDQSDILLYKIDNGIVIRRIAITNATRL